MNKINILAIVGSLRKESYNLQLALLAKEILLEKANITVLNYDDVPFMNQDIEFPPPLAVKKAREIVLSNDGIWFFTPEYNHFFSGVLKNLIDWLSRPISGTEPQVLKGKPAAISGISRGMSGTGIAQDHLVTLLSYLNMTVMNAPRLVIPYAMDQLDIDGKLKLTTSLQMLEKQAFSFIDFIEKNKNL